MINFFKKKKQTVEKKTDNNPKKTDLAKNPTKQVLDLIEKTKFIYEIKKLLFSFMNNDKYYENFLYENFKKDEDFHKHLHSKLATQKKIYNQKIEECKKLRDDYTREINSNNRVTIELGLLVDNEDLQASNNGFKNKIDNELTPLIKFHESERDSYDEINHRYKSKIPDSLFLSNLNISRNANSINSTMNIASTYYAEQACKNSNENFEDKDFSETSANENRPHSFSKKLNLFNQLKDVYLLLDNYLSLIEKITASPLKSSTNRNGKEFTDQLSELLDEQKKIFPAVINLANNTLQPIINCVSNIDLIERIDYLILNKTNKGILLANEIKAIINENSVFFPKNLHNQLFIATDNGELIARVENSTSSKNNFEILHTQYNNEKNVNLDNSTRFRSNTK